jgi:hypothetical protein
MISVHPRKVIAQDGLDSIQRESIQRLSPGQWLNDEVISYFLVMLSKRDEEMCRRSSRKRCHFFQSFMTKLFQRRAYQPSHRRKYEYKNVKRWSKKVPGTCFVVFARVLGGEAATLTILMLSVAGKDIFKLDKIVFPINQEHALGLRRHLHAGKAHPVFDSGRRRNDVPGKSI